MNKKKRLVVEVHNKQLDALEDLLHCELTKRQVENRRKEVKKLWQALVSAYDHEQNHFLSEAFHVHQSDLRRAKRKVTKPDSKAAGEYRLSYFLHELKIGEVHFIRRKDWVSNKPPSERLRNLQKTTAKRFEISRADDGSGWWVERIS